MRSADRTSIRSRVSAALIAACVASALSPRAAWAQDASSSTAPPTVTAAPPTAPSTEPAPTAPPAPIASSTDDETSNEKTVGIVLLVSAGAAVATGIGLGVASVIEHRRSRDLLQEAAEEEADLLATQSAYAEAIAARDDLRVASGVAAGAGLLMFLAAGTLFAIDEARDDAAAPPSPAPSPRAFAVPVLAPGHVGASASLRF